MKITKIMSDLNTWLIALFKDTLLSQIGQLVQKYGVLKLGAPLYFL